MKTTLIGLIWGILLTGTHPGHAGYELIHHPEPKDPMRVHIYRLDNGLTEQGHAHELLIMKSNGGVTSASSASRTPLAFKVFASGLNTNETA